MADERETRPRERARSRSAARTTSTILPLDDDNALTAPFADAAPTYQRLGWSPLPLPFGRKHPPPTGWTGYSAPYASGADVQEWCEQHPDANIGLRMPPNVLGLDVDNYDGKPGLETVSAAIDRLGPLPKAPRSTSRPDDPVSGIRFYKVPPGRAWADAVGPGVEVIHHGHRYAVVAPSMHPEGRPYAWYAGAGELLPEPPAVSDLPELPDRWIAELDRGPVGDRQAKADVTNEAVTAFLAEVPAGPSCAYVARIVTDAQVALAGGSTRHDATRNAVARVVRAADQGHTGVGGALDALRGAWSTALRRAPARTPEPGEWGRMVAGAVALAVAAPTPVHDRGCCPAAPAVVEVTGDAAALESQHRGQVRMAYRLADSHTDQLMFVHGIGWHTYDDRRWVEDDQGAAKRAVLDVLRQALAESWDDKALRGDVTKCESAAGVAGVLDIAAALEAFAFTVAGLDADPYRLNVANGTLDLRSFELSEADPADRITKVTRGAWTDADPGRWDTFLQRVLPDDEVRSFVQRLAGVGLLGVVVEHVLGIMTGIGRNGKGVFYGALNHALGDYATVAEPDLFMHREGAHPTGEMDLRGVRWCVVSENDRGRRLAEATMKRLTGGDEIKARRMRQDFVRFKPSHTPILVTNHLPVVAGDDPALWARIRVVPFDVVIPVAERDGHLEERLQLDADAIVSWCVVGYRDYLQRGGLDEPDAVRVATDDYRKESDAVRRFVDECCISNVHMFVTTGDAFERWCRWSVADGAEHVGRKAFGQALDRLGYRAEKGTAGKRLRRGIGLAADESEAGE